MNQLAVAAVVTALVALPAGADTPKKDCGQLPGTFEGLVFSGDGDTIYGVGYAPSIRLWGIQAPELRDKQTGQESTAGMRTRAALEDLLAASGHRAKCEPRKWDRYCRVVASCSAGTTDVSLELLKGGMAYGFWLSDTAPDKVALSVSYATAEAEARKARRGLWKDWLGETK
jgi:endonuclease YncB( thermonuclease family)